MKIRHFIFGIVVTFFSCKDDSKPRVDSSETVLVEEVEVIEEVPILSPESEEIAFSNRPAQEFDRKGSIIVDDLISMLRMRVDLLYYDLRTKYQSWGRFNLSPEDFKLIYNHPSGKRTVCVYDDYRLAFYDESTTQLSNWNYLDDLVRSNVRPLRYEKGAFRSVYLYDDHVIVLRKFGRGIITSVINSAWLKENADTIRANPNYSSMRNEGSISPIFRIEYPLEFELD